MALVPSLFISFEVEPVYRFRLAGPGIHARFRRSPFSNPGLCPPEDSPRPLRLKNAASASQGQARQPDGYVHKLTDDSRLVRATLTPGHRLRAKPRVRSGFPP